MISEKWHILLIIDKQWAPHKFVQLVLKHQVNGLLVRRKFSLLLLLWYESKKLITLTFATFAQFELVRYNSKMKQKFHLFCCRISYVTHSTRPPTNIDYRSQKSHIVMNDIPRNGEIFGAECSINTASTETEGIKWFSWGSWTLNRT